MQSDWRGLIYSRGQVKEERYPEGWGVFLIVYWTSALLFAATIYWFFK